ncbi:MAG: c-type cytochrome [Mangrovicoccus sp.]
MKFSHIATAALIAVASTVAAPVMASDYEIVGDAAKGEKVFRKCKACHMVGDGAKSKVGPVLNGVLGRTAGTFDGFKYSAPMIAAGEEGLVWAPETIGEFLTKPKDYIKGTKMAFAGLRKQSDVDNVVAYLATFE